MVRSLAERWAPPRVTRAQHHETESFAISRSLTNTAVRCVSLKPRRHDSMHGLAPSIQLAHTCSVEQRDFRTALAAFRHLSHEFVFNSTSPHVTTRDTPKFLACKKGRRMCVRPRRTNTSQASGEPLLPPSRTERRAPTQSSTLKN